MRKFNYFCSVVLVITMALMIVTLSSNLILRTSATYTYHFNDSEAMSEVSYSVEEGKMASEIASYWSSFSSDRFQVYEINGQFKDPIFKSNEQDVMRKVKSILNIELLAGVIFMITTIAIYVYLVKNKFNLALKNRFRWGTGLTVLLLIAQIVTLSIKGVRTWLYTVLIGIELKKTSTLAIMLGDPFFKSYLIFSTVLAVAMLAVFTYINHKYTKPSRIFY